MANIEKAPVVNEEEPSTEEYSSNDEDEIDTDLDEGVHEGLEDIIQIPKARRGLTRLPKLRTRFTNSGGEKHKVTFDSLGRFAGEYRSEFSSFLGDLVREHVGFRYLSWKAVPVELKHKLWDQITYYYDIDGRRRKFVMNRMGGLLRNFRRKMYARFIQPNLGKPGRLAKVPNQYRTLVDKSDWEKFVAYTQSDKFQDTSTKGQTARTKHTYVHHMGRGGYPYLREKLVKKKEIAIDEIPSRAYMWRKGREDKNGEYQNVEVKGMAEKLIEVEERIRDGDIEVDPDQDAITVVFGKEKGHYLKGVGCGVTASAYWTGPRRRGDSKEKIAALEQQLHNERLEREKKDAEIKTLSSQVAETNDKLNKLLTQIELQGQLISANGNKGTPSSNASIKDSRDGSDFTKSSPIDTITPDDSLTKQQLDPAVGTSNPLPKLLRNPSKTRKITKKLNLSPPRTGNAEKETPVELPDYINKPKKCTLCTLNLNNPVAHGQVYLSKDKGQTIHGVPLQSDCYRVSIDKVIKGAAFLPYEAGDMKTVEEAHQTFVAWPRSLIRITDQTKEPNGPVSDVGKNPTPKITDQTKEPKQPVSEVEKNQTPGPVSVEDKNPTGGMPTRGTPTRGTPTRGTPTHGTPTRRTPTRATRTLHLAPAVPTPTRGQKQKALMSLYTSRREAPEQSKCKKKKAR